MSALQKLTIDTNTRRAATKMKLSSRAPTLRNTSRRERKQLTSLKKNAPASSRKALPKGELNKEEQTVPSESSVKISQIASSLESLRFKLQQRAKTLRQNSCARTLTAITLLVNLNSVSCFTNSISRLATRSLSNCSLLYKNHDGRIDLQEFRQGMQSRERTQQASICGGQKSRVATAASGMRNICQGNGISMLEKQFPC